MSESFENFTTERERERERESEQLEGKERERVCGCVCVRGETLCQMPPFLVLFVVLFFLLHLSVPSLALLF